MEVLPISAVLVKCPHCGGKFNPEDAIGHDIRLRLEKEYQDKMAAQTRNLEKKIRQQEIERYSGQLKAMEDDRKAKALRLRDLEAKVISISEKEQNIREREERLELEMKKRLLEREKLIYQQAEQRVVERISLDFQERELKLKREQESLAVGLKKQAHEAAEKAREEERLKNAELQKKLDDQVRLVNEMKRKSEQGSMQLQGEVQELAIEEYLVSTFCRDEIQEISKGKRGADCVHVVKDQYGRRCGAVLYESKRTKHFASDWIVKMKDDMRLNGADIGVIVTEAFPEGMTRFGAVDGIWVCSFMEFKALAFFFRHHLVRVGEVVAAQENRGEKTKMVYSYVTGNEFKQKLEAAFESYSDMQQDLMKEKTLFAAHWAKREKKLLKAMENLVALYGDVRGIAGGAVQEIRALEMRELEMMDGD